MTEPGMPQLAEYTANPFIARLPALQDQKSLYRTLLQVPLFDAKERDYPAHLRKHCIVRLANGFLPQPRQLDLADRFGLLLRQGYLGRDPSTTAYLHHLHNGLDRIQAGDLDAPVSHAVQNTASSFALLGCPGVGKTRSMNRVLAQYPQIILHETPFSLVQLVWLRLEAPALGSLKQLCIDFFDAIDRLIGSDYVKRYATGVTVERIMSHMAHVAQLHALGVLIIDEIQHLKGVKVGPEALLKFMVKLVNTIGVPVIPIGTLGALTILQGSFSQARRASGLGSLHWDRMTPNATWDRFLAQLWRYQWTNPATELTPELGAVIYDESQGVADLTVKLFMLAQLRVVTASEFRKHQSERLSEQLFRTVAREEFAMVRPMIEALRLNDRIKLSKFDDLRPLGEHVEHIVSRAIASVSAALTATPAGPTDPQPSGPSASPEASVVEALTRVGIAADVAQATVNAWRAEDPSGDPLALLQKAIETLTTPPKKAPTKKPKPPLATEMPPYDLRRLIEEGTKDGASPYDALLNARIVRPPLLDFAA